jgi:ribonuclease HII
MARIAGVDEAGRGCIVGPLVVAAVVLGRSSLKRLVRTGVRDSKLLSPTARARLFDLILSQADGVAVEFVPPDAIDAFVRHRQKGRTLNYLEALAMARVLDHLRASRAVVDAPDPSAARFGRALRDLLMHPLPVEALHHADRDHVCVGAASIIAKVERDRVLEQLRRAHGNMGSGYPSDSRTIAFLRSWLSRHGAVPPFARRTWRTWARITQMQLSP